MKSDKRILEEIKEEIAEVINKLSDGKTPSPDGLGPEYYKHLSFLLIPKLKTFYNKILEGETIHFLGNTNSYYPKTQQGFNRAGIL